VRADGQGATRVAANTLNLLQHALMLPQTGFSRVYGQGLQRSILPGRCATKPPVFASGSNYGSNRERDPYHYWVRKGMSTKRVSCGFSSHRK
jgi:hypothetical protein